MIFKLYNSDFGIKINGVNYDFDHVNGLQVETAKRKKLTRGGNASNKLGLTFTEGVSEPDVVTVTIMGMSPELKGVLDSAYDNSTRLEVYAIDRTDGSSKIGRNSILSTKPQQLNLDDSQESMNVALIFETFDLEENHKS
jgi:hypothetical protein